jgi:hypothetical protein
MPRQKSAPSKEAKTALLATRKALLNRIERIEAEAEQVSATWEALLKKPAEDAVAAMVAATVRGLQAEWSFYLRCLGFHANRLREFKVKEEIADATWLSLVNEDVSRLKARLLTLLTRAGAMVAAIEVASEEAARTLEEAIDKAGQLERI